MTLFDILTILKGRKLRAYVIPQNNAIRNEFLRSKDRQLLIMLFVQIFATIISTVLFSVVNVIAMSIQYGMTLSEYSDAINRFCNNIGRIILYFNPVIGFYIGTRSTGRFRDEIKHTMIESIRLILTKLGLERFIPVSREQINEALTIKERTDMSVI